MPNFLTRWWEQRSLATPSPELLALFSSGPTDSGATVSPQSALSVPAVFSCCQVLSQDVARTPIRLRVETAPDVYEDATSHPLYELLHDLANPEQTAYQFKSAMQWNLLLYGRAYAEVVRVDGRVVALWPLISDHMHVDRDPQGRKRWTYMGGQVYVWTFDASQPPILELTMQSPLVHCREIVGTALALGQYTAKFFANGAKPSGMLMLPAGTTQGQADALRDLWATHYGGAANRGKTPVLSGGVSFTPISSTNDDSQMIELVRAVNEQIAGAFRVPPWKIGDLSKANYSNMESGENAYVTSTLDPYFEAWEQAVRRDLLTSRQFGHYAVTFDRSALVRNDVKALHDSLSRGIQNGYLSQNDARKALGLNPIPDGDRYMVNSALQPVGANPHVT